MTKFEIQNKIYIYSTFALDAQPPQYPILPMSRMYIYNNNNNNKNNSY